MSFRHRHKRTLMIPDSYIDNSFPTRPYRVDSAGNVPPPALNTAQPPAMGFWSSHTGRMDARRLPPHTSSTVESLHDVPRQQPDPNEGATSAEGVNESVSHVEDHDMDEQVPV